MRTYHRVPFVSLIILSTFPLWATPSTKPLSSRAFAASPQAWRWRDLTPAVGSAPEARRNGSAVYDPVGQRVIIFGGTGLSGLLNDTWAFNLMTRSWVQLDTRGAPPPARFGHNAEYDPIGHQMVIWAGQGRGFFDDTWTLNLQTYEWRDVSPGARPKARYGSSTVYDSMTRSVVIFAGFTSESGRFNDSQAFGLDTNSWSDLTPAGIKPQIRCLLTAALDRSRRRMIIYGGQRNGPLDDLWAFDLGARTWTDLTPAQRPSGRYFTSSFVDRQGRFIVFGGQTSSGSVNETWAFSFDTAQWNRIDTPAAPAERNGMMGAYVPEEDRFIIFGGTGAKLYNDVWDFRQE